MARPTPPSGWQKNKNFDELFPIYESKISIPSRPYKIVLETNVATGVRQLYKEDPALFTRSPIALINSEGKVTKQSEWNNISAGENGTRTLNGIINISRRESYDLIKKVGYPPEISELSKTKEYAGFKIDQPAPAGPGSGNPDQSGGNTGGSEGSGGGGATSPTPAAAGPPSLGVLRGVENYDDPADYGNFTYPEKLNRSQDYMIIRAYNYKVADVFAKEGGTKDEGILKGTVDISQRSFTEILGSVTLPMPANISEANQTKWGSNELSGLTAGIMGAVVGGVSAGAGGDLGGVIEAVGSSAKKIFGETAANAQIKQQLTLNAAASVVKKLGMAIDAESYRARVTGTVINPNLELLFNGPALRQFQFQYKLAPRSETEARQIRGIIKFFKKSMAPKRSNKSNLDAFFLGAPNVFQIKFMNGGQVSKSLPTLKTCALVNFNVNYTADGFYSAYKDNLVGSQPISITIDMSFAELTPIYNDHYDQSDGVGFKDLGDLENPEVDFQDISELGNDSNNNQRNTPPTRQEIQPASIPVVPFRTPVVGGGPTTNPRLSDPQSGISNLERYDAAKRAGFSGTFNQWLTTQNN